MDLEEHAFTSRENLNGILTALLRTLDPGDMDRWVGLLASGIWMMS